MLITQQSNRMAAITKLHPPTTTYNSHIRFESCTLRHLTPLHTHSFLAAWAALGLLALAALAALGAVAEVAVESAAAALTTAGCVALAAFGAGAATAADGLSCDLGAAVEAGLEEAGASVADARWTASDARREERRAVTLACLASDCSLWRLASSSLYA